MWPLIAMAALSAVQYSEQQKKAARDRKLAAKTQELSPWTGLQAGPVNEPSAVGTIGSGLAQGYAMQQSGAAQDAAKAYQDKSLQLQQDALDMQRLNQAKQFQMGANSSYGVPAQYTNQFQQSPYTYMNRIG